MVARTHIHPAHIAAIGIVVIVVAIVIPGLVAVVVASPFPLVVPAAVIVSFVGGVVAIIVVHVKLPAVVIAVPVHTGAVRGGDAMVYTAGVVTAVGLVAVAAVVVAVVGEGTAALAVLMFQIGPVVVAALLMVAALHFAHVFGVFLTLFTAVLAVAVAGHGACGDEEAQEQNQNCTYHSFGCF